MSFVVRTEKRQGTREDLEGSVGTPDEARERDSGANDHLWDSL